MIQNKVFFADTYALIEILNGTPSYKKYARCTLITSKLNLAELHYYLLKNYDEKTANKYLDFFQKLLVPVSLWAIKLGMKIKLKYKKQNLSYVDAISYASSLEYEVLFLTGDKQFKEKQNVEFVK